MKLLTPEEYIKGILPGTEPSWSVVLTTGGDPGEDYFAVKVGYAMASVFLISGAVLRECGIDPGDVAFVEFHKNGDCGYTYYPKPVYLLNGSMGQWARWVANENGIGQEPAEPSEVMNYISSGIDFALRGGPYTVDSWTTFGRAIMLPNPPRSEYVSKPKVVKVVE